MNDDSSQVNSPHSHAQARCQPLIRVGTADIHCLFTLFGETHERWMGTIGNALSQNHEGESLQGLLG